MMGLVSLIAVVGGALGGWGFITKGARNRYRVIRMRVAK